MNYSRIFLVGLWIFSSSCFLGLSQSHIDFVDLDMRQSHNIAIDFKSLSEGISRLPLQTGDAPSIGTCHKVLKYQGHYYLLAQIAGGFYHIYIYDEDGALVNQVSFDDSFFAVNLMEIELESEDLVVVGLGRFELRYDLEGNLKDLDLGNIL